MSESDDAAPATAAGAKTILVIDDHIDTAKPLARMLTHFGHRGLYETSGEAALHRVRDALEPVPDLILLDAMMPGMDGLEVLRALRADPRTARLPIVVFSAVSDPKYREHAMRKGATDFWVKASMDFDELRVRVERLLA
jgi:CheY-like chemotaxis protein